MRFRFMLLTAAAAMVLAACGSGTSSPQATTTTAPPVPVLTLDATAAQSMEQGLKNLGFKVISAQQADNGEPSVSLNLGCVPAAPFYVDTDSLGSVSGVSTQTAHGNYGFSTQPTPTEIQKDGLCKS